MGAAGLGNAEDAVPDVASVPRLTTSLNKLPHLLECRAEGGCNKEQVVAAMLTAGYRARRVGGACEHQGADLGITGSGGGWVYE